MDISNKKIVFHIHTKYSSDCNSEPSEIVDTLYQNGISIAIITDHNTIKGAIEAKEYAKKKYGDKFTVIVGEEVLSDIGDIIGFPINDEIPKGNYQDVINEMKFQKASVCLPHPYKSHNLFLIHEEQFLSQFDFIEIYNSRISSKLNDYALKLNQKHNKIPIIGNDAHTIEDLKNCFVIYNNEMVISESLTKPTPMKNIRKSQMIDAKKKHKIINIIKYFFLTFINK
jgi:predicted metal-dependent phosphoesterase TrpH